MAITFTFSNHIKADLMNKEIDLDADTIKVLLVRSGFVYDKDDYAELVNMKADTGVITFTSDAASHFTRPGGSFITDGFVAGNEVTVTGLGADNGTYTVNNVTALVITVDEATAGVAGDADEQMVAEDELTNAFGYAPATQTFTVTEDDANDRANCNADGTVTWTAAGGSIGPTPGAIIYDDTATDDPIICYIDFDGEQTATVGTTFDIASISIRLT